MYFLFLMPFCYAFFNTHPVLAVENVKEVLKLSVEQKGVRVTTGELTIFLDGLTVNDQEEIAPATNGNATSVTSELNILYVQCDCSQ